MTCNHTDGEKHDSVYVELRNRLLDRAAAWATACAGVVRDDAPQTSVEAAMQQNWNRVFAAEMGRLWGATR